MSGKTHKTLQGGFSNAVWWSESMKRYTTHNPVLPIGGYIGGTQRTTERDVMLEDALAKTGLGAEGTAFWLTSTDARHLLDGVDNTTTKSEFRDHIARYTKTALIDVAVWSNPDHRGTWASSRKIKDMLRMAFSRKVQPESPHLDVSFPPISIGMVKGEAERFLELYSDVPITGFHLQLTERVVGLNLHVSRLEEVVAFLADQLQNVCSRHDEPPHKG